MMKPITKLSMLTATGLGALLLTGVTGCTQEQQQTQEQPQAKGAFVIIEEVEKGKYQIKEEFPAETTRIVLQDINGTERVLTQEEMDKLIKEEEAKIDNGTSNLTNPPSEASSGGMSLGETLLASAAGAMLGAWIGNKLFGNQNYQNNRKASYKSPSTYSKSASSFNKSSTSSSSSTKKSGFFGNKSTSSGS
jgi:hypothetical protein